VIKNTFHSRNARIQRGFEKSWLACPQHLRLGLADILEQNLCFPDPNILSNIAKILGSIIRMNCVSHTVNNHFERLLTLCSTRGYAVGVLRTVSAACNQLYDETDFVFTHEQQAVVYKTATMYLSSEAADKGLLSATLDCIADTFEVYETVISSATMREDLLCRLTACKDHADEEIVAKSLEVINRYVDAYSRLLKDKLPLLCQFYLAAFDRQSEPVSLQAFIFWDLLCTLEMKELIQEFLPVLLEKTLLCLTKEDIEDTEWTPHKAAASLLALLTEKYGSAALESEVAQNFIVAKMQDAAVHARGAPHRRGCPGKHLRKGLSRVPLQCHRCMLADLGNAACESEALFALARICERDIRCTTNFLPTIIDKCGVLISNHSGSSINAVWVYNAIICSIRDNPTEEAQALLNYHYTNIIQLLMTKLSNLQPGQHGLRNALCVALSKLIALCPPGLKDILNSIIDWLVKGMLETLHAMNRASKDQMLIIEDVLSSYVVLLGVSLETVKIFNAKSILDVFIQILHSLPNKAHGEIYIVVSHLLRQFAPDIRVLMPCILRDVSSQDHFISGSALNLLATTATHMEDGFSKYTVEAVPALINAISSSNTPLEAKPRIIEVFGEVALAIGRKFEPYVEMAMVLFKQINSLSRTGDEEYVDELRRSVIVLFDYIIMSVGPAISVKSKLDEIMALLGSAVCEDADAAYQKETVDIVYDINRLFAGRVAQHGWTKTFLEGVLAAPGINYEKAKEIYQKCY